MKRSNRLALASGVLAGFFLLGPLCFVAFLIQNELHLLPGRKSCPDSVTLNASDAELSVDAKSVAENDCTLLFTSSEGGASGGGPSLAEWITREGGSKHRITVVRDTEGFAPMRALFYFARMPDHLPRRVLVILNSHYALEANQIQASLAMSYFADRAGASMFRSRETSELLLRATPDSQVSWPRLLQFRTFLHRTVGLPLDRIIHNPTTRADAEPELAVDAEWGVAPEVARKLALMSPDSRKIGTLRETAWESGIIQAAKYSQVSFLVFPLNSTLYTRLGLNAEIETQKLVSQTKISAHRIQVLDLDQKEFWHDSIHFNSVGRRALARRLITLSDPAP